MPKKLDLCGQVFGRLTVLRENGRLKDGQVLWRCKCDCGNEVTVRGSRLKSGKTSSCGCYHSERAAELLKKHGLSVSHHRLYMTVYQHFRFIKDAVECYSDWQIDSRYTPDSTGVVRFCEDLIALQPIECERYESDKSLEMDKDNDRDHIFRPESIVFVSHIQNCNNRKYTLRTADGTALADFCRSIGIETRSDNHVTKQYSKYCNWFKYHNGEGHPELLKKANDLISLYRKCLELLKLRDEVADFKHRLDQMSVCSQDSANQ